MVLSCLEDVCEVSYRWLHLNLESKGLNLDVTLHMHEMQ